MLVDLTRGCILHRCEMYRGKHYREKRWTICRVTAFNIDGLSSYRACGKSVVTEHIIASRENFIAWKERWSV